MSKEYVIISIKDLNTISNYITKPHQELLNILNIIQSAKVIDHTEINKEPKENKA